MSMLSRYTNMQTLSRSPKMSFIKHWKAAGALVSLKGMTHQLKEP